MIGEAAEKYYRNTPLTAPTPPRPPSSPALAHTGRVLPASLPALIRKLKATREPDTWTAAAMVHELREEPRAIPEQLAATQERSLLWPESGRPLLRCIIRCSSLSLGGEGRQRG